MRMRKPPRAEGGPGAAPPATDVAHVLEASRAVNSVLEVREALHVVLASAKHLLDAHEGSVMLLGLDRRLRIVASEGIPPEVAAEAAIPLGEGVSGRVAETGQPALLGRTPEEGAFRSFVPKERALLSGISVPLRAAGVTVGVLNLNLVHGDRMFTEADVGLAQVFAEQAAMAIHKAQLLEEARRRAGGLERLLAAGRSLVGTLDAEALLARILDGALELAGSGGGVVLLVDEQSGRLLRGVYRGIGRDEVRAILGRPGFGELLRAESPVVAGTAGHAVLEGLGGEGAAATVLTARGEGTTRTMLLLLGGEAPDGSRLGLLQSYTSHAGLAVRGAQLHAQLSSKESELASIVRSMANPVVVVDGEGKVIAANPAAEDLFSISVEFVKGQPVRGVLGDERVEGLLTGEAGGPVEVGAGRPVSRTWKARVSVMQATPQGGGGRVLVMDDVTAEREAEKLKADFVALVGHELRTPLTLVKGFIKTLIRRGEHMSPEQVREALGTADAQTQRLERLIEDLLYVSRIETSRPTLHLETADLVELVRKLLEEFHEREPGRTFRLESPHSVRLTMDRTKIEQVAYHLLDNACKYSAAETSVTVRVVDGGEQVEVSVTDRGRGILSADIPRLFERFHQVDSSSTREHGGTGVGLFICRSLVEAHGGRIAVESIWGKGSTFRFTIPKGQTQEISPFGMPAAR